MGVRRAVNPALKAAGGRYGPRRTSGLWSRSAQRIPDVRFLATFLSRENQHELCVCARKFNNLMPFGCWWFAEQSIDCFRMITRERLELLGASFIPQHSDARVLEQLIYKWSHARVVIAASLSETYEQLLQSGRAVTREGNRPRCDANVFGKLPSLGRFFTCLIVGGASQRFARLLFVAPLGC